MADDRIYMQCNICGKKLYLGKQFGWQPFYWESYDGRTLEEKLNEFFEEHYHPGQDAYMWNGNFIIVYESDNDGHKDEIWRTNPADTVRCEDCKHYDSRIGVCHNLRFGDGYENYTPPFVYEDFFCKDGEKMEE